MLKGYLITKSLEALYIKEKYKDNGYLCIEWKNIIDINKNINTEFLSIYEEEELLELIELQEVLISKLNLQIEKKRKRRKNQKRRRRKRK